MTSMIAPINAAERAEAGGESSPLSRFQKMLLAKTARRAWAACGSPPPGEAEWRREQSLKAAGVRISTARQSDYTSLRAHFLDLARQYDKAFRALVESPKNKARIAHYHLKKSCAERGLPLNYPASICHRQFKCSLDEATAKQLWCLVFTIRNRRPLHPSH